MEGEREGGREGGRERMADTFLQNVLMWGMS